MKDLNPNKLYNRIILLILLTLTTILFLISISVGNNKIDQIKYEKYNSYAKHIQDEVELHINNKKDITLSIALALSRDQNIVDAIIQQDINKLKLKEFSQLLEKTTKIKNAWFQIIDKDGNTFYRSWREKRGDPIVNLRLDIAQMIKNPQIMSTISTGRYDMTFKTMVPIYNNSQFIGIFEIITHFNSIHNQLLQSNMDSVIVVDKSYKKQLTKPLTNLFIDDFYVANFQAKKSIIDIIKHKGIDRYLNNNNNYILDKENNKFIVVYKIPDINGNKMGTIIVFQDIKYLNMNDIIYTKNNIISYNILIVLLLFLVGYYLISKRQTKELDEKVIQKTKQLHLEKNHVQSILDTSPSILLVTKDAHIISANKSFFRFFNYKNIEEFKNQYDCICDLFTVLDNQPFSSDRQVNGELWSSYLINNQLEDHFVSIEFQNKKFEFLVSALYLTNNKEILLSFTDITDIKNKDKVLAEQSKMASMGEMIGNIAHQWRQPLSIISTTSTGIKFEKEMNVFDENKLIEKCDLININAQYLSKTIDDFRNFIKGDRKKVSFIFNEEVEKLLNLIKPSLKANDIEHIVTLENNIILTGYPNELIQSLINIVNNAKDVLKNKEQEKRLIFIDAQTSQNTLIIKIKDNGGGISNEVMPHLFEPYFTTKHASIGTGIGLHMTYNFIVDGMHGKIEVKNSTFEYNEISYMGACFILSLPIN